MNRLVCAFNNLASQHGLNAFRNVVGSYSNVTRVNSPRTSHGAAHIVMCSQVEQLATLRGVCPLSGCGDGFITHIYLHFHGIIDCK
jgi:hypothetical protein